MGTRYNEAVLTSTHNQCFRAKLRKIMSQFYYIKMGCKGSTLHGYVIMTIRRVKVMKKQDCMHDTFSYIQTFLFNYINSLNRILCRRFLILNKSAVLVFYLDAEAEDKE